MKNKTTLLTLFLVALVASAVTIPKANATTIYNEVLTETEYETIQEGGYVGNLTQNITLSETQEWQFFADFTNIELNTTSENYDSIELTLLIAELSDPESTTGLTNYKIAFDKSDVDNSTGVYAAGFYVPNSKNATISYDGTAVAVFIDNVIQYYEIQNMSKYTQGQNFDDLTAVFYGVSAGLDNGDTDLFSGNFTVSMIDTATLEIGSLPTVPSTLDTNGLMLALIGICALVAISAFIPNKSRRR